MELFYYSNSLKRKKCLQKIKGKVKMKGKFLKFLSIILISMCIFMGCKRGKESRVGLRFKKIPQQSCWVDSYGQMHCHTYWITVPE